MKRIISDYNISYEALEMENEVDLNDFLQN